MQTRHPLARHAIRLVAALALALGLTTVLAGPASAHTSLTGSDPAEAATLTAAPTVITLTFNQEIGALNPLIVVAGPGDTQYQAGDAIVDRETVSTGVNPLGVAGTYTVAYRVISADGHPVEGQYTFQYAPPPAETSAPTPGITSDTPAPSTAAEEPATTSDTPDTTANSTAETSTTSTSTSTSPVPSGSTTPADTTIDSVAVDTTSNSGGSTWVYVALAATAALVVAAIAVFIAQRRRSGNGPS